jgi:predicted nucleic acid-binding protein
MKKIVFDADGLIKLIHAGVFNKLQGFITEQVFQETVVEGKKRLYEDAFTIEKFVQEKKIEVKKIDRNEQIPGLGRGEISCIQLYKMIKADVIISDDRKFLNTLEERNIPFVVPTECIVGLVGAKKISQKEGIEALDKIKPFVKKENYDVAMKALGGKK